MSKKSPPPGLIPGGRGMKKDLTFSEVFLMGNFVLAAITGSRRSDGRCRR